MVLLKVESKVREINKKEMALIAVKRTITKLNTIGFF